MKRKMGKKRAESVSIIGGADGPTSIFLVSNNGKRNWKQCIRSFLYEKKKNRVKKKIVAKPHTLEEVIRFLKKKYGAVELSKGCRVYQEQRKSLREALILRYRPELLGEFANLEFPGRKPHGKISPEEETDKKALEEFWHKLEQRSRKAEEIPENVFPIDYHIYEIRLPGGGKVQAGIETVWKSLEVSWSGSKKSRKQLSRISGSIYWYYGVSEEDIKEETERYASLVTALC